MAFFNSRLNYTFTRFMMIASGTELGWVLIVGLSRDIFVYYRNIQYYSYPLPLFRFLIPPSYIFFFFNFILYILSVRFNMINSIHNFILQANLFYKVSYVLLTLVIIVALVFYFYTVFYSYSGSCLYFTPNVSYKTYISFPFYLFVFYVLVNYLYFYILKSTTSLLLTLALSILISFLASLSFPRIKLVTTALPLLESTFFSAILGFFKGISYLTVMHFYLTLLIYYLFVYYGVYILLALTFDGSKVLWLFSFGGSDYLNLLYKSYLDTLSLNQPLTHSCLKFFYADGGLPTTGSLSRQLVVYPSSTLLNSADCVNFFHKSFSKLGLSFSNLAIYLLMVFTYFLTLKRLANFKY